jgi:hypothetical protein
MVEQVVEQMAGKNAIGYLGMKMQRDISDLMM